MMHSTHFIYGYMASDHKDHSDRGNTLLPYVLLFRLAARVLLHVSSHRQDNTSCGAQAEREIVKWVQHEGSIL